MYQDANDNGKFDDGHGAEVQLGPVVITGANLTKATATFLSASQLTQGGTPGWQLNFTLDKEGAAAFATATTELAEDASGPEKQLAILLDRRISLAAARCRARSPTAPARSPGTSPSSRPKNLALRAAVAVRCRCS